MPDLILIARGGGSASEIAIAANSPKVVREVLDAGVPYYSAIGHEIDVSLLDKFADESFHTPTDVSHRLKDLVMDLKTTLYREEQHRLAHEASQKSKTESEMLKASLGKSRNLSLLLGAALAVLAAYQYFG